MTEKLYYQDQYQQEFDAVVLQARPGKQNTWEVLLDQTAFYPEGGGQPCDFGWLDHSPVLAVHEKEDLIWHTTGTAFLAGQPVHGVIDWERRFCHMQQHSGEHLLSGLIHQCYGYDNVGFHMGKEEVTIDFNGVLTSGQLWEVEVAANRMIYENIPISVIYPDTETLSGMDYRSKKELTGIVRIVDIPGGDRCACCGTHVHSTGAIGIIKTTGMINYKGGVRISIQCGLKALADYEGRLRQNEGISRLLSVKQSGLVGAVEKLKADSAHKDGVINRLYSQLADLKLAACEASDKPLLIFEEELPALPMRRLCTGLYEQGKGSIVMVCSGNDGNWHYVIGSNQIDMRIISKELNRVLQGQGGGSALMAQGTFRSTRESIKKGFLSVTGNLIKL